jgi:F-type H+-transporting ATPase subunit b
VGGRLISSASRPVDATGRRWYERAQLFRAGRTQTVRWPVPSTQPIPLTMWSLGVALSEGSLQSALSESSGGAVNVDLDLTFVGQMVVFATLIIILKPLLFDPVLGLFQERERRTEGARAEARRMQEKAGELLREYEREMEKVHRVAGEERDKMRAETARLEAREIQEARAIAAKIVEEGRQRVAEEIHEIKFDLGRNSERLARDIAARVLGREVPS